MTRTLARTLAALALLTAPRASAAEPFEATLRPLAAAHCVDCHGPDVQKAGLRLDNLSADLRDPAVAATWVKVHDKLAAGEMPPKKREPVPPKELAAAVKALHTDLHAASLARQRAEGRAVLRRLNNTEYENTVRELVGTGVNLRDLLPEENATAGFDNVGTALDLSPTH